MTQPIVHLTPREAWLSQSRGDPFSPPGLDSEGFVHCSTPGQVVRVADQFFRGQRGLILLVLDPDRLTAELRWEPPVHPGQAGREEEAPISDDLFPHIYGPINPEAVIEVVDFEPGPDGLFSPPVLG